MINFTCSLCKGKGHTYRWSDKWVDKRQSLHFKLISKLEILRNKTCDYCIGTGIDLNRLASSILMKSKW